MSHNLAQRITVAAIAIPATIAIIYAGGWVLAAALAFLGGVGALEIYHLAARKGIRAFVVLGCWGAAAWAPVVWLSLPSGYRAPPAWVAFLGALWLMAVLGQATATRPPDSGPLAAIGVTIFGTVYGAGLPAFLLMLRHPHATVSRTAATALALLPLVTTWICDTAAMTGGAMVGGRKLAPLLSPGKTWAGALAGGLASVIVAPLYGLAVLSPLGLPVPLPALVLAGVAVATMGQFGDLAESLLKREAGVKDSGTLFPGHGGVLDRLDSLYWTIPVVALVMYCWGVA